MSWVNFCWVGSGKYEWGEVFFKLPNFAGVAIDNLDFEEVLSFKAQLPAINWHIIWVELAAINWQGTVGYTNFYVCCLVR